MRVIGATQAEYLADDGAQDEFDRVLDRIVLAEIGLNDLERFAVLAVEAGYSRRYVATLTGLSRRRVDQLIAGTWLALIGNPLCHFLKTSR